MTSMRPSVRAANITTTKTSFPMDVTAESIWLKMQLGFLYDEGLAIGLLGGTPNPPWEDVLSQDNQPHLWEVLTDMFRHLGLPGALAVRAHWDNTDDGEHYLRWQFPESIAKEVLSLLRRESEVDESAPAPEPTSEPTSEPEAKDNDDDEEWEKVEEETDDYAKE
ncbi:Gdp GTP exchange factor sec2p [Lasiodiplodia theobromae]|uniref:Gdp GTP exchange factor sec2p n=1 Tax=Lasiodiplodia theobromae TaxID=45133 RepID=UPI0015C3D547|nr:Gdp GTP exchange factor sec2p [Lasiodiplodia theobromae]KAF4546040.1 Gdp GTP exchange factor sec2p [Lasiodiplodia theobromae]